MRRRQAEAGAAARVKTFADRATWRSTPGAWAKPAHDPLTSGCIDQLRLTLEPLPAEVRREVIAAIGAYVWEYRLWREKTRGTPNGRAFRRWCTDATKRLTEIERWLSRDPLPNPVEGKPNGDAAEQMTWERLHVATQVKYFREWIRDTYDPRRQEGRPIDWVRSDLEGCVGAILHLAGLRPTTTVDGVYAEVLGHVYRELGVRANPHRAARTQVAVHREWKDPILDN